jgi:hypothetical protein
MTSTNLDSRIFFAFDHGYSPIESRLDPTKYPESADEIALIRQLLTPHMTDKSVKWCKGAGESPYIRDSHVVRYGGSHLIPKSMRKPDFSLTTHLRALLPPSASSFYKSGLLGMGFYETNTLRALRDAIKLDIPFLLGNTSIEGGNCFIFTSPEGKKRALVGEISLYFTLIGLEEGGHFSNLEYDSEEIPTMSCIRMARNLQAYDPRECHLLKGEELKQLYRLWQTPVPEEEIPLYIEEARKIQAKVEITRALIAEEIDVEEENILFLPQTEYHIDMELFVTPDGKIAIHDPNAVLSFLRTINYDELTDEEKIIYQEIESLAYQDYEAHKDTRDMRKTFRLENSGLPFCLFPGILKTKKTVLNYCNGIFVKNNLPDLPDNGQQPEYYFVTTGPSRPAEQIFHRKFQELIHSIFPNIKVVGVPMSDLVGTNGGGMHCLTFEG